MSRYDLFRRRIAPIAFGLAIVLIARDSCNKDQRTHATIVFDAGAGTHVDELDAQMFANGELFGTFKRLDFIGSTKLEASLPAEDGELEIDLVVGGKLKHTSRHFHAVDASTLTVPLADLATP